MHLFSLRSHNFFAVSWAKLHSVVTLSTSGLSFFTIAHYMAQSNAKIIRSFHIIISTFGIGGTWSHKILSPSLSFLIVFFVIRILNVRILRIRTSNHQAFIFIIFRVSSLARDPHLLTLRFEPKILNFKRLFALTRSEFVDWWFLLIIIHHGWVIQFPLLVLVVLLRSGSWLLHLHLSLHSLAESCLS